MSDTRDDSRNGRGVERRKGSERRTHARGGRRRTDWPADAGITRCPRCGFPHPQLVSVDRHDLRWWCPDCRGAFVTKRATTVIL